MMINKFNEFISKFKFITHLNTDIDVARELKIDNSTFATMKRNDRIPYEQVINYCKDKCIDLNWIINIKNN
ncbi:hypothetical protein CRV06_05300 [Halarcobacter anaerophilus]|uniref:Bacteriophage CI repressor N-terminal domain-containing protein n=2 Tax=Halarcobacter anaerophilus TaxID=877500 RepID=A0A4Q0Y0P3_9BACT|nr:transcriptional regulator, XRE family [Halarcobacter anaerophilus]RXJ63610.1 hypothetical protein CRV06_05300 [Halarcobacter anaerophilus]